ncbi:MAG TPA: fluoride efflux transporter CrcB [Salinivirgaceae bacterium]|nr:fluoride efflux transporter CrcB [Salinivirgaceae bacterium]
MKNILLVGVGGFIGSSGRYVMGKIIHNHINTTFPLGTLMVNLIGSLLLGMIFSLVENRGLSSIEFRLFFAVGICGGFTTFSSFANENFLFIRDGNFLTPLLYSALSLFVGIFFVYLGYTFIKNI